MNNVRGKIETYIVFNICDLIRTNIYYSSTKRDTNTWYTNMWYGLNIPVYTIIKNVTIDNINDNIFNNIMQ